MSGKPSFRYPQIWQLDMAFGPVDPMMRHILMGGSLEVSESGALKYHYAAHGKSYDVVILLREYADILRSPASVILPVRLWRPFITRQTSWLPGALKRRMSRTAWRVCSACARTVERCQSRR